MGRNYSIPTIKVLFAEASRCGYPMCDEPLIFRDRGATTVVGQIAHIRSEREGGPRHDPTYPAELIDESDNLLLLCGKHHPVVDRHESTYTVEELETWKRNQQSHAGAGTAITEAQVRVLARLTAEEAVVIAQIARFAERVIVISEEVQESMNRVEAARRSELRAVQQRMGPIYAVDDDGKETRINDRIEMSYVEQQKWAERIASELAAGRPRLAEARRLLREEIAVLAMMSGIGLAALGSQVAVVADGLLDLLGNDSLVTAQSANLRVAVANLWATANGEVAEAPN